MEEQKANLIVCNPPYVRHHHLTKEQKLRLKKDTAIRTHVALNGLAGLYCYFLLLSDAWLANGGLAVWLVPAEFMDVNYGSGVKEYLCRHVLLQRIHRFDPVHVQFDDALVSSAVIVFEKVPHRDREVEFTFGGTLRRPMLRQLVPLRVLKSTAKWTAFPENSPTTNHQLWDIRPRPSKSMGQCWQIYSTSNAAWQPGPMIFLSWNVQRLSQLACRKNFWCPFFPALAILKPTL
jgi:hypothetical protein